MSQDAHVTYDPKTGTVEVYGTKFSVEFLRAIAEFDRHALYRIDREADGVIAIRVVGYEVDDSFDDEVLNSLLCEDLENGH